MILIVREERLSAQLASPSKRIKVDEQATTSSEQNVTNASAVAPRGVTTGGVWGGVSPPSFEMVLSSGKN